MNNLPIKIEELKIIVVCQIFKNECNKFFQERNSNGLQFDKIYLYTTYRCLHGTVIVTDVRYSSLCQGNSHTLCVNNINIKVILTKNKWMKDILIF